VGLSFFLGDCEVEGPDVVHDELSIHVHQGDLVFMGRLSERVVRVIVALREQQTSEENRDLTIEDFQRAVDRIGVRVKITAAEWMTPFRVSDRQAKHYRIGSVFLAGDASHIHSPVGGQGMNTGIQDAANLAWKLAAVAHGANERLLDSYEEERGEVGKALLRFTERGLQLATVSNPILERVRDALADHLDSATGAAHSDRLHLGDGNSIPRIFNRCRLRGRRASARGRSPSRSSSPKRRKSIDTPRRVD